MFNNMLLTLMYGKFEVWLENKKQKSMSSKFLSKLNEILEKVEKSAC